ncbi:hypothetical protein BJX99DRAFT_226784 [Aspergillus californicus]
MRRLPQLLSAASPARQSCLNITSRLHPQLGACSSIKPLSSIQSQSPSAFRQFSYTLSNPSNPSNSPFRLTTTPTTDPKPEPSQTKPEPEPEPEQQIEGEYYSPYKPKRQWPPDMSKLSPKHQFRLERKYRRRAALKYARPKWTKATKLVQGGAIAFVLLYALLFMEWDDRGGKPIEEFRTYIFGTIKDSFSAPPSPASMRRSEESVREGAR